MFPNLVERLVRLRAFSAEDLLDGVNREIAPVLRDVRQRLNELLTLFRDSAEPLMLHEAQELELNDGTVIVTLPGLTLTLPPAADYSPRGGQRVTVRNRYSAGVGDTTILPHGTDTIEGIASYTLTGDGTFVTFVSSSLVAGTNANNWDEIA